MNQTLEAMARALFQSWFVDFDPVRAKAEGRDPGLLPHFADLFPGSFVDSELGKIPDGWSVGRLADTSSLNPESWSKSNRPQSVDYIDLANTKWGRVERVVAHSQTGAPSRAQRVLRPWDTVVGVVRPGNGSFALILDEGLTGSTGFAVLRPKDSFFSAFNYLAATSPSNIESLSLLADGGAYPAVRPEDVANTNIALPNLPVLSIFAKCVEPWLCRMHSAELESRTLASLRDTLLPKLISGELHAKDIERAVECAV